MHKLLPGLVHDVVFRVFSTHLSLDFSPACYFSRQLFFLEVQRGGGTLWLVREIRDSDGVIYEHLLLTGCGANPSSRNFRTFRKNILLPFLE